MYFTHGLALAALASTVQSLLMFAGTNTGRVVGELLAGRLVDIVGVAVVVASLLISRDAQSVGEDGGTDRGYD